MTDEGSLDGSTTSLESPFKQVNSDESAFPSDQSLED